MFEGKNERSATQAKKSLYVSTLAFQILPEKKSMENSKIFLLQYDATWIVSLNCGISFSMTKQRSLALSELQCCDFAFDKVKNCWNVKGFANCMLKTMEIRV